MPSQAEIANVERMFGMNEPTHHHRQYATREDLSRIRGDILLLSKAIDDLSQKLDRFTTGVDRSGEMPPNDGQDRWDDDGGPTGEMADLVDNHGPQYP